MDFKDVKSILFVPAKEKMLKKIRNIHADAFVIDLEDSIKDEDKEQATNCVNDFLSKEDLDDRPIFIRVNKKRYLSEISKFERYNIGFVLPKFDEWDDYVIDEDISNNHNFIALIESPLGIINICKICQEKWISAIAFGAEDYTTQMKKKNSFAFLEYEKNVLVITAKAYGKYVYDTPCFSLVDEQISEEVVSSMNFGFDGKLAVHPRQIEIINNVFLEFNAEYYKKVIAIYDKSQEAVISYEGKVYEKMHIEAMRNAIEQE